jgi:hypothetical protein
MKKITFLSTVIIVIVMMASCHKIEHLSSVPHIEYTSFKIFDTTDILGNISKGGRLKFHFEDGDGDLGLATPRGDSLADTTNLFLTLFRKKDGIMTPAASNDILYLSPYRIPYMARVGQNKILKGTVSVTFLYLFYTPADTIRYDFHIIDRAQNVSNVASTNEIVIATNKTY